MYINMGAYQHVSKAYKNLHESGLELEGNLNKEEALNHNLHTQLQSATEVNKRWDQAYHTLPDPIYKGVVVITFCNKTNCGTQGNYSKINK